MSTKLTLKKLRAKNFRSVGNMWMEIDYSVSKTTLIVSNDNGAGKSTLSIWALYYALFGKPYKKDTKLPSLVNSMSGKDLLVEVEFTTQGNDWVVRRGRKPDIFDILRDGKRVEDEAALKDYQVYLQSVIGMDDKAFEYIVALGPDKFVPFTVLNTSQRRSFVEQVLDITVISSMNEITKDRIKAIKKESEQKFYDIGLLESKLSGHRRTLDILQTQRRQRQSETESELSELKQEVKSAESMLEKLNKKSEELLQSLDMVAENRLEEIKSLIDRFRSKRIELLAAEKRYTSMTSCPTCLQCVTEEHKKTISEGTSASIEKLNGAQKTLETELDALNARVVGNNGIREKIAKLDSAKPQLIAKISAVNAQISSIHAKASVKTDDVLIDTEAITIHELSEKLRALEKDHQNLKVKEDEHMFFLGTLKDDAVKAEIVKQYIPVLNQKVNEYLDLMNLYIQMSMDEEFNISMFAPNRKGQTIENLSTGQLRRVDLAVLLAWRDIARSKASVSTNILILDEILENLSQQGVADFMELWSTKYSQNDINLFVISQRNSEFDEFFDRTITYALKDDRTVEI